MSQPALPPAARTAGRVFAIALGVVALLAVVAAAWIGVRGASAYSHVREIQAGTSEMVAAFTEDPATAAHSLAALSAQAAAARELTSDPVWGLAEHVPWAGPQLAAFATVAAGLDDVLERGLTPIAQSAGGLSLASLRPSGGAIDTSGLSAIAEPARAGADIITAASASVGGIDRTPLLGLVADAVDQASDQFAQVATATDVLAAAAALLPDMLGTNGARTYLVIVQNNAEWRSLGGIAGAGVLLRTDGGALSLAGTVSSSDFPGGFAEPVATLSDELTALFQTRPTRYFQNITQVPDFAVGAPVAAEMLLRQQGVSVDGVIALDPVVLSYLLKATGPVTLPTGDVLTHDNAVSLLLNEVYFRYADSAAQDAFFAAAAGSVFEALAQGQGAVPDLLSALARAGNERRLLVWSAAAAEQEVLAGTTLAGPLPVTDAHTARFGVYLNDGTGSKMSYYTHPVVSLAWGSCQPAGVLAARELTLTTTLTSTAPADAATSLPQHITGGGWFGTPAGTTAVVGNVYLPAGYELGSSSMTAPGGFGGGTDDGRQVLTFGMELLPGQSETVTVTVRATTTADEAYALVTPTADASLDPTVPATCGALG